MHKHVPTVSNVHILFNEQVACKRGNKKKKKNGKRLF